MESVPTRIERRPTRPLAPPIGLAVAWLMLAATSPLPAAQEGEGFYRGFVDAVGETIFALAWPTAEYERVAFGSVTFGADGAQVSFRLHGKSAWDDGPLWVEVMIDVRDGRITDLRWGRHNALLAEPGETIGLLSQALEELTAELARSQGSAAPSAGSGEGYRFVFTNGCRSPVQLAIRYRDVEDRWRTEGWWTFAPGKTAHLASDGKVLRSNRATWYYFAESLDGSRLEWSGDEVVSFQGRRLSMRAATDEHGDSEWTVTCD